MTDQALADRAAAMLGIGPVQVRRPGLRDPDGDAFYDHRRADGSHAIIIRDGIPGIRRVYAIAHECAHAAQVERLGFSPHAWRAHYLNARDRAGTYRANPYEKGARMMGAIIAAELVAGMEE